MRAGQMDRRLKLQHRKLDQNERGEDEVSYGTYATVWGRRNDLKGREYFAASQMNSEATLEFTIRWRADVVETDQVIENGVSYNIRHIAEIPRRKGLILMTTSVQNNA